MIAIGDIFMCTSKSEKRADLIIDEIENCPEKYKKRNLLEQINNCIKCTKFK